MQNAIKDVFGSMLDSMLQGEMDNLTKSRLVVSKTLLASAWTVFPVWKKGSKAIFPQVVIQRCIVHLIRNFIKYIPSNDYKEIYCPT